MQSHDWKKKGFSLKFTEISRVFLKAIYLNLICLIPYFSLYITVKFKLHWFWTQKLLKNLDFVKSFYGFIRIFSGYQNLTPRKSKLYQQLKTTTFFPPISHFHSIYWPKPTFQLKHHHSIYLSFWYKISHYFSLFSIYHRIKI